MRGVEKMIECCKQVKIGFTGVHGSGKSAKAKEWCDRFINDGKTVFVVDEVARSCPYALGTIEAQEWVWTEQMKQEKHAMEQDVDVVITDRTVLGNLIYYRAIIEDHANLHDWRINFFRWLDLYHQAIDWMPTYDHVVRMPLNLEWLQADDPIRSKGVEYAKRIDKLFDRFVEPFVTDHGEVGL